MASQSSTRVVLFSLLTAVLPLADALGVTPNSPCASVCSDSSSSNVTATDTSLLSDEWQGIVCTDGDYDGSLKGQSLKSCLSCLQSSNFTETSGNDQDWFLYNMRYSFDYCVFGYPNSTGFNSGPCMTSEACGGLITSLEDGIPDPTNTTQYAYCDVDGGSILGTSYEKCIECTLADEDHFYMSNFLVALHGACQTTPAPGSLIPLNATVFSKQTIHIVNATMSASGGPHLSAASIAGISVGAFVLLSLAIGCVYMQIRKRKNRSSRRGRASVLSFSCQTDVSPAFHADDYDQDRFFAEEKPNAVVGVAVNADPGADGEHSSWNPSAAFRDNTAIKPSVITTTLPPPSPALTSSQRFSPDDYVTPTSTISTRSSAPLLPHHPGTSVSPLSANSPPTHSPSGFSDVSPHINQSGWQQGDVNQPETLWEEEQPEVPSKQLSKKKSKGGGLGSPVHSEVLQTSFPPPPKR